MLMTTRYNVLGIHICIDFNIFPNICSKLNALDQISSHGWVSISLVPCVHSEVHSECVIVVAPDVVPKTAKFSAFNINSTIIQISIITS